MDLELDNISIVVYACFILHNFCCERHNVYIDEEQVKVQIKLMKRDENNFKNLPNPIFSCSDDTDLYIHDLMTLSNYIFLCTPFFLYKR